MSINQSIAAKNRIKNGTQASGWKLTENQKRKHAMFGDKNPSKRLDVKLKMRKAKLGKGMNKEEYRKRRLVRIRTHHAVERGLINKEPCSICGDTESFAHHENYDKPFDVIWLCRQHHTEVHVKKGSYNWLSKY
ncbi:hypothetical protein MASR2M39_32290 [Ignavibacteriales bacterium]